MHSLSDAEDFTEGYRALKLGPVVGEPTAGWIIFTSDVGLLDGSSTRARAVRCASPTRTGRTWRCIRARSTCRRATRGRELHAAAIHSSTPPSRSCSSALVEHWRLLAYARDSVTILRTSTSDLLLLARRAPPLRRSAGRAGATIRRPPSSATSISFVRCSPATARVRSGRVHGPVLPLAGQHRIQREHPPR